MSPLVQILLVGGALATLAAVIGVAVVLARLKLRPGPLAPPLDFGGGPGIGIV